MEASDAAEVRGILEEAYGVRLRLRETRTRRLDERLKHERVDVGAFAIDDVDLPGDMEFSPDPLGRVVALAVRAGRLEGHCDGIKGEAAPGEVAMVSQADRPHYSHAEDLSVTSVLLASYSP